MINDLQILVQPMWSKQELNADSCYVIITQLITAIERIRPNWSWFVLFPDKHSGYKYEPDGFFARKNVFRIPQRVSPRKMANACSYDGGWYDELVKTYGFDLIWCNLVEVAAQLTGSGGSGYTTITRPAVISAHNYVIHDSLPYPWHAIDHVAALQLIGSMKSEINVVNSDHCQWMLLDIADKLCSRAVRDKIEKTIRKINICSLNPERFAVRPDPPDPPIVAYNHRIQGYKRFGDTFDALHEVYKAGVPFKARFLNNSPDHLAKINGYPFVEVSLNATHAKYLDKLSECSLNAMNSAYETFCIAAVESMAFGQPLVAPQGVTFPEITGQSYTKYPWLFKHTGPGVSAEQVQMLTKLLSDREARREWGGVVRDHVLKHYTHVQWAEQYVALFEEVGGRVSEVETPDDAAELLRNATAQAMQENMTLSDYAIHVCRHRVSGRQPFARSQSFSQCRAVREARRYGATIKVANGTQTLHKTQPEMAVTR